MNKQNEIAILFSGGTDSTCVASMMAEKFDKIHLLTFKRFGFFESENSCRNVAALKEKFAKVTFVHRIIDIDHLARYVSYHSFIRDLFKYGFFTLSNCIYCGLINHAGALLYCLDNRIAHVADGSTREWPFFPTHMENVIAEFKKMYAKFNMHYHTPVYDFELPEQFRFVDKLCVAHRADKKNTEANVNKKTTGSYLLRLGILPSSNVKGTALDHKMQPRCLQFILHHIYLYWYFMVLHDYSDFERVTVHFLREKINSLSVLVSKYPKKIRRIAKMKEDINEVRHSS